jgi:uncharacterized protein
LEEKFPIQFKKISAEVTLQKSPIGIRADFRVKYSAEFACVRCLCLYGRDGDGALHLDYIEGQDPYLEIDNVELKAHDADKVYYRGPHIDLAVGVREAIILSQPIMHLCKDDCRGLCPVCGINLNLERCSCIKEKAGTFTPQKTSNASIPRKKKRAKQK